MSALIIAEHDNQQLLPATIAAIDAAKQLTNHISLIIIGYNCQAVVEQADSIKQLNKIILVQSENYQHLLAENICPIIISLCQQPATSKDAYQYLIIGSTTFGRNLLPRIAACLNVELISDVIKIKSPDTFERLIYNGNIIQTVQLLSKIKCLTIRTINFNDQLDKLATQNSLNSSKNNIELLDPKNFPIETKVRVIDILNNNDSYHHKNLKLDLTTAKIVVAGGAALKSKENFKLIEELAALLKAAIGASKSAVDAGFAPNNWQIGQTGKIIAPNLYIAIGISGAAQHLVGIKESKIIVAINLDENAPICKIANYVIIGDLFKVIPDMIKELSLYQSNTENLATITTKLSPSLIEA
ncbi:MAG: electron transfer flavoprotein subunit alpha/FixB family protein [Gammaproteobacteria bacterium]